MSTNMREEIARNQQWLPMSAQRVSARAASPRDALWLDQDPVYLASRSAAQRRAASHALVIPPNWPCPRGKVFLARTAPDGLRTPDLLHNPIEYLEKLLNSIPVHQRRKRDPGPPRNRIIGQRYPVDSGEPPRKLSPPVF
jgi:hypothetical protein